jgi:glycine betaine catabolism B
MKDVRFAKFVLFVNGLVPAVLLAWDVWHGQAGANPTNFALRTTGFLALTFLSLSLLVTPLRRVTGNPAFFHFRRFLGLYAFSYAVVHFSVFFVFDRAMSVADTLSEMAKRRYLVVGSVALVAMLPLAVTSTNSMIRRMGPARWRALHRLAYLSAIAGVAHFYMLVKSDTRVPVRFAIVVALLLGYRVAVSATHRLGQARGRQVRAPFSQARWNGQLRVQRIVRETPDVRTFRLVSPSGGALPFRFSAGQYLSISLRVDGRTLVRPYTIASAPTADGYCEISVKREAKGAVSRHLHDVVSEGDVLSVSAPSGRFTFDRDSSDSVALIAAGVGITPLMSILRDLTARRWTGRIFLFYSSRTEPDIIFREELGALQGLFPNVHLSLTLTRSASAAWEGGRGRIDAACLTRAIPDPLRTPFYLCGPTEMVAATRGILRDLGVADEQVHTESFGPSSVLPAALPAGAAEFTVTFARSQRSGRLRAGIPMLALAEELEIAIDSECRSGICGRCKHRLLSGSVAMQNQDALGDDDRRDDFILLCQARALEDATVDA